MIGNNIASHPTVLVIDDDPMSPAIVRQALEGYLCVVSGETSGNRGLDRLRAESPDVVVLDHVLPDSSGLEILHQLQEKSAPPVIFITAHRTAGIAIEAMKRGAFDYLTKPLDMPRLRRQVERAVELNRVLRSPRNELAALDPAHLEADELVGECPAMQYVFKAIGKVATRDICVLIRGEQGTGKESVAQAIHQHSLRAAGPFIKLHCPSYDAVSLEQELFGATFRDTEGGRPGRLQAAAEGTLLLQEVGSAPLPVQGKLLNVIRERRLDAEGTQGSGPIECRIVASSSRDLESLVRSGRLRSDLYYLLSSYVITLPPLRKRHGDLGLIIKQLLPSLQSEGDFAAERPILTADGLRILCQHTWPGNIDELRSVLRQAIVESRNDFILPESLNDAIRRDPLLTDNAKSSELLYATHWDKFARLRIEAGAEDLYEQAVEETDRKLVTQVLQHTAGNQAHAARILGITRASLRKKLRQLGLEARQIAESDTRVQGR